MTETQTARRADEMPRAAYTDSPLKPARNLHDINDATRRPRGFRTYCGETFYSTKWSTVIVLDPAPETPPDGFRWCITCSKRSPRGRTATVAAGAVSHELEIVGDVEQEHGWYLSWRCKRLDCAFRGNVTVEQREDAVRLLSVLDEKHCELESDGHPPTPLRGSQAVSSMSPTVPPEAYDPTTDQ